jgi:hypothetical protein
VATERYRRLPLIAGRKLEVPGPDVEEWRRMVEKARSIRYKLAP